VLLGILLLGGNKPNGTSADVVRALGENSGGIVLCTVVGEGEHAQLAFAQVLRPAVDASALSSLPGSSRILSPKAIQCQGAIVFTSPDGTSVEKVLYIYDGIVHLLGGSDIRVTLPEFIKGIADAGS
jgi:hypothetical protein